MWLLQNGVEKNSVIAEACNCSVAYVSSVMCDLGMNKNRLRRLEQPENVKPPIPKFYEDKPEYNYRILTFDEWKDEIKNG